MLPFRIAPYQGSREKDAKQQIAWTPETLAIGKECHDKRLHTIAHRHASRQQEKHNGLENGELLARLHLLSCQIDGQHEQRHGACKVVGDDIGQRDKGKREGQVGEQVGIETAQSDNLTHGTTDEDKGIERENHEDNSHYNRCHVLVGPGIEPAVDFRQWPQEVSQQRVTMDEEGQMPLRQRAIDERVETRHAEVVVEVGRLLRM